MIRITSISGQVFIQPKKRNDYKVEKIQPASGPIFQNKKYENNNQQNKKSNHNEPQENFEDVLKRELDKRI